MVKHATLHVGDDVRWGLARRGDAGHTPFSKASEGVRKVKKKRGKKEETSPSSVEEIPTKKILRKKK